MLRPLPLLIFGKSGPAQPCFQVIILLSSGKEGEVLFPLSLDSFQPLLPSCEPYFLFPFISPSSLVLSLTPGVLTFSAPHLSY